MSSEPYAQIIISIVVLLWFGSLIATVFHPQISTTYARRAKGRFPISSQEMEQKFKPMVKLSPNPRMSPVSYKECDISLEYKPNCTIFLKNAITLVKSDFSTDLPGGGRLDLSYKKALALLKALDEKLELPPNSHPEKFEEVSAIVRLDSIAATIYPEKPKIDPKTTEPVLI